MQSLYSSSVCLRCLPNVCYWFPLCVCSGCSSGVALATPANHRPASGSLHNIKYKQNNRVGDFYSGPHTHGASTTTTNISIFSSNTFLCLHLNRCWWKFKCNFAIAFVGGARSSVPAVPVVFSSSSSIDNCMQQLVTRWPAVLQCFSAAVLTIVAHSSVMRRPTGSKLVLQTIYRRSCTITETAPTWAG